MHNEHPSWLDYQAIRRKIERGLSNGMLLITHMIVFIVVSGGVLEYYTRLYESFGDLYPDYVSPDVSRWVTVWSALLLAHALFTALRSGLRRQPRERLIEAALNERIAAEDTELLQNPRRAFRLRDLFSSDIEQRSGYVFSLLLLTLANAGLWLIMSLSGEIYNFYSQALPYQLVIALGGVGIAGAWLLNRVRRRLKQPTLQRLVVQGETPNEKQKHHFVEDETAYGLADDGELVALDDYIPQHDLRKTKS
jgi:hypothetical protein